jgi:urease accessory protein
LSAKEPALPRLTVVVDDGASRASGSSRSTQPGAAVLTLRFGDRRRSRLRARLDDGREIALLLPRGTLLHDGARLSDEAGDLVVVVRAAEETLSWARADDLLLLARAAYHLGNRHVPVQIGPGWLAYEHDHVLDGMIAEMGLSVEARRAPFEPEAGGYRHGGSEAGNGEASKHGGHHHHEH